jgi:hypothetical protein
VHNYIGAQAAREEVEEDNIIVAKVSVKVGSNYIKLLSFKVKVGNKGKKNIEC